MTPVHLHLALNHLPILLPLVGLTLLGYGLWGENAEARRFGLIFMVAAALTAWPVYFSGDEAEERLEGAAWASGSLMEEHEEAATAGLVAVQLAGAASAILLFLLARGRAPRWTLAAAFLLSTAAFVLLARAGYLGGQIRHDEVRTAAG